MKKTVVAFINNDPCVQSLPDTAGKIICFLSKNGLMTVKAENAAVIGEDFSALVATSMAAMLMKGPHPHDQYKNLIVKIIDIEVPDEDKSTE